MHKATKEKRLNLTCLTSQLDLHQRNFLSKEDGHSQEYSSQNN